MNSRISRRLSKLALLSGLMLALPILLMPMTNVTAQEDQSQARSLEGAWRAQITLRVCQTGAEIRSFPAVVTFERGGTMHATAAAASPSRVTSDVGHWWHTGGHSFAALTDAFLFSPTGDWIGTQRVTRTIEIGDDPNSFTADTTTEILDPGGNLLATGCATAVAHRFD